MLIFDMHCYFISQNSNAIALITSNWNDEKFLKSVNTTQYIAKIKVAEFLVHSDCQ